jgi:glycosyltransferase involved in cell wall biosynthesis
MELIGYNCNSRKRKLREPPSGAAFALAAGMITIFTPSFADEFDTNAQNLTVKEIVARMPPQKFQVIMLREGRPDSRIAGRPNTLLIRCGRHGTTARILYQILRRVPDIYFYPREGPLDAAFIYLRRKLRLKTAIVTHVVSGGLDSAPCRQSLARNIREAKAVFANCNYLAELVRKRLHVEARTIHNGIDRRYFFPDINRRHSSPQVLRVLFAGSFRLYKRADLVVQQAARWPQVQFLLAGAGEDEPRCRSLARELNCANVEFLGHLSLQQLGEEMRQSDVFLFPSILEGHPQVLGQAAACGLPVVAMDAYRPDYVVNGVTGFLAASDDELIQKLDLLLDSSELRQSMSHAAAIHALTFDWDKAAKDWERVFEEVVATRHGN